MEIFFQSCDTTMWPPLQESRVPGVAFMGSIVGLLTDSQTTLGHKIIDKWGFFGT